MQAVEPVQLLWLSAAILLAAGAGVVAGCVVARRRRRRGRRGVFVLGFVCGVTVTALAQRWAHGRQLLAVLARGVPAAPRRRAGILRGAAALLLR